MKILVQRSELEHPVPARLVETARGTEVRGEHLLCVVHDAEQVLSSPSPGETREPLPNEATALRSDSPHRTCGEGFLLPSPAGQDRRTRPSARFDQQFGAKPTSSDWRL